MEPNLECKVSIFHEHCTSRTLRRQIKNLSNIISHGKMSFTVGSEVDTTVLDEEDLAAVLDYLKHVSAHFYGIGTVLHLKQNELQQIERENRSDCTTAMIKVIISWLRMNYDTERFGMPTWKALVEAVASPVGGNNADLAMKIAADHPAGAIQRDVPLKKRPKQVAKGFSCWHNLPVISIAAIPVIFIAAISLSYISPTPPVPSPAIADFRDYLELKYNATPMDDKNRRWLRPENSRKYIRLTLVEGSAWKYLDSFGDIPQGNFEQEVQNRTEISVEQMLGASDEGNKPRLVLIEGAPGIGKSCLAWELCKMWANKTSFMKEFRLIILYRLREKKVQEISNVRELFYFYDTPDIDRLVNEINNNGSGILFILDGFDELPKAYQHTGFPLLELINERLPGSRVIITTRPSATEELLKHNTPQRRIEVLGFDQESVEEFASDVLKDKPETLEKFKAYTNPVINSMMYVPLNAAIILHIFEKNQDNSPRTLTELYSQLCLTILNEALVYKDFEKVDNFKDLPDHLYKQFCSLLKIAFEGIENDEVIFYSPPPDFVDLGFLDAVSTFDKKDYTYNFLHLTIQEFFAAYYISTNESSVEIFQQYGKEERWNVVWRFVAGLTGFKDYVDHIDEDIFFSRYKTRIIVRRFFIQCFFEANSITYNLTNATSLSHILRYRALDAYALGYTISNFPTSKIPWSLVISDADFEFLVPGLTLNQPVAGAGAVMVLNFSITHSSRTLAAFNFSQLFPSLHSLKLQNFFSHDLIDLSEIIPDMHCLETLDISKAMNAALDNQNYSCSLLKLLQELSGSSVISLNIRYTQFFTLFNESYHEYNAALKGLIKPPSGKLKELIVGEFLYDYPADSLMKQLSSTSSLETLHLHKILPHLSLINNTKLTKLVISCGVPNITKLYAINIAEIVKHNKVLKHLKVRLLTFPTSIIIADAVIQNNNALESVELSLISSDYDKYYKDIEYIKQLDSRIKYS